MGATRDERVAHGSGYWPARSESADDACVEDCVILSAVVSWCSPEMFMVIFVKNPSVGVEGTAVIDITE